MDAAKKQTIKPADFAPRTKKVAAKKSVQAVAAQVAAREGGKTVVKAVAQTGAKMGAKTFAKGMANPWLLAADGVEFGVGKIAQNCGADEDTAKAVGKGSGLAASIGIGAAVGGPLGAVGGIVLWGIGEGIAKLFDWD